MAKRDLILHNFWWKLTSLILATGVWITFHSGSRLRLQMPDELVRGTDRKEFANCPVSILKGPNDPARYKVSPAEVTVEIVGESPSVHRLMFADLQVFVDARDQNTGLANVVVYAPDGFHVESVSPSRVHLELAK